MLRDNGDPNCRAAHCQRQNELDAETRNGGPTVIQAALCESAILHFDGRRLWCVSGSPEAAEHHATDEEQEEPEILCSHFCGSLAASAAKRFVGIVRMSSTSLTTSIGWPANGLIEPARVSFFGAVTLQPAACRRLAAHAADR